MPILIAIEFLYGGSDQPAIKLEYLIKPRNPPFKEAFISCSWKKADYDGNQA